MSRSRAALSRAAAARQTRVSDRVGNGGFRENNLRSGEKEEEEKAEGANSTSVLASTEDGASALMLMFTVAFHGLTPADVSYELTRNTVREDDPSYDE